jgi:hypothetical protein
MKNLAGKTCQRSGGSTQQSWVSYLTFTRRKSYYKLTAIVNAYRRGC